ncbi:MAG: hypothetical protein MK080_09540 [Opitutales bacterium]|nr:hypothetical protein [Opitutales bacterium]NRA27942.1 hypothetical protein [Opitutales bacterium]
MVAWTWMIVDYAAESTWTQAIEETFSGERPCELCLAIQAAEDQGREDGDNQIAAGSELKFFARERHIVDPPQGCVLFDPPRSTDSWDSRNYQVPEPPPRGQA